MKISCRNQSVDWFLFIMNQTVNIIPAMIIVKIIAVKIALTNWSK